ncbi:MAG: RecX family transcriptional regulator [Clostridia bacterium]|jgi:regulatory protein|nr:RecX family transcriptional regulator [Clostridia bacterium]
MSDLEKAKSYCFKYLSKCLISESSMCKKLKDKGFNDDVINKCIDICIDYDYLNDSTYTSNFISNSLNFKNWGYFKIKQKLIEKGIKSNIIEKSLDMIDFKTKAIDVAERKFSSYDDRDKTFKYMQNNGFKTSEILYAFKELEI